MKKILINFLLILFVILLFLSCKKGKNEISAQKNILTDGIVKNCDWPEFHGKFRDNISHEKELLKKWPNTSPKLILKIKGLGIGFSTVSIVNNRIYTAGIVDDKTYVFAFNMNGKLLWKSQNGNPWSPGSEQSWAKNYKGSRATPTYNDNMIYHCNELGFLTAFNAENGKNVWEINLTEKFDAQVPFWAYSESVIIDGKKLICYPGGTKGYMIALDKKTGKVIWANTTINSPSAYCSPIIITSNNIKQIITLNADGIIGVDLNNGKLLWSFPFTNKRKINIATPIYYKDHVFASSGYGAGSVLIKLLYKNNSFLVQKVWENKELDNHHGGIIRIGNYLYGTGHHEPYWFCLDFFTGKILYKEKGVGKGSLTYADGMLYCLGEKGKMGLVEAKNDDYNIISEFEVPSGGEGLHWAHPVVCGGRLYIRHSDQLFIYNISLLQ